MVVVSFEHYNINLSNVQCFAVRHSLSSDKIRQGKNMKPVPVLKYSSNHVVFLSVIYKAISKLSFENVFMSRFINIGFFTFRRYELA